MSSQSGGWWTDGSAAGPQPRQAERQEKGREGGTEGRERLDASSKSRRELAVSARTCFIV